MNIMLFMTVILIVLLAASTAGFCWIMTAFSYNMFVEKSSDWRNRNRR